MGVTRDIRTFHETLACDVCGRTLLRGETAETWLSGGTRHEVCDLCTARARHEGWVREDARLEMTQRTTSGEGRPSLLGRLRARRRPAPDEPPPSAVEPDPVEVAAVPAPPAPAPAPPPEPREPRQVRAVPTAPDQRVAAALEVFNGTDHTRTIAGVARSLGLPTVHTNALDGTARVAVVVSWELCWYRYTVDLGDGATAVEKTGQGYELEELAPEERLGNAGADENGALHPIVPSPG